MKVEGIYKSGSNIVEIVPDDDKTYTIIRHIAGLKIPEYMNTKKQIKKYTKNLQKPSSEEEAKFLLLKHI